MTEPIQHEDVVSALAAVKLRLGGIPKLTPQQRGKGGDERGVSYAYRSIDQIASEAQPLFGEYGIVLTPNVKSYEVETVEVGNRPWRHITMMVEYNVYGPNGSRLDPFVVIGEGRDNSDKGMNKAQTAAYKNALLRILDIGDPQDDPDHERHETDAKRAIDWSALGWNSEADHEALKTAVTARIKQADKAVTDHLRDEFKKNFKAWPLSRTQMDAWIEVVDFALGEPETQTLDLDSKEN